jgi:hypothetical protein
MPNKYVSNKSLGVKRPPTAYGLFCQHVATKGMSARPLRRVSRKSCVKDPKRMALKWF